MYKRLIFAAVAAAGLSLLGGCGGGSDLKDPVAQTDILLPAEALVRYGPHERQIADIYFPQVNVQDIKGVALWIHGGGWIMGHKDDSKPMTQVLTEKGVVVVNMNYRLSPEGAFPNSVNDVKTVLSALANGGCATCDDQGLFKMLTVFKDLPLFVGGSSSGGYLALMGTAEHLTEMPRADTCIYNHVGPPDMRILDVTNDFGRELIAAYSAGDVSAEKLTAMSPVVKLESGAWDSIPRSTRFLLSYGLADEFVPFATTRGLTELLIDKGFPVREVLHDFPRDGGHAIPDGVSRQDLYNAVSECFFKDGAFGAP